MKKYLKKIIKNIYINIRSLFHLISWIIKLINKENLKNYITKEDHLESIYILGNGPSLNLISNQIKKTTNIKICVVNFAILSPLFREIKPQYYVIADPAFFSRPIKEECFSNVIEELQKVNWKLTIHIPYKYYNKFHLEIKSSYINVIPFHTIEFHENMRFDNIKYLLYKSGLACPRIQNVIIGCIYCMINSGFKNIYLYGVEHSWTSQLVVNDKNQVCLKDVHFYDNENIKSIPWKKLNNEIYKMHEILRTLSYTFIGYHDLQRYAHYLGDVKIINKTKNSFIDAFPKE